jgi:hypothetical protein
MKVDFFVCENIVDVMAKLFNAQKDANLPALSFLSLWALYYLQILPCLSVQRKSQLCGKEGIIIQLPKKGDLRD